jgi:prephenate dehydrogenase
VTARAVVLGGAGAVGGMVAGLLRGDGAHVTVADRAGSGPFLRADATAPSGTLLAALRAADTVVLALPEDVIQKSVHGVAAAMGPDALLVDTSSVKSGIVGAGPHGRPWVSLNPMFAPSLGIAGRPVAAVVVHGGDRAEALLADIARWGGRVVRMTADEHDRTTAATQGATHAAILAFGLALHALGTRPGTLEHTAPPPHRTLLALLARLLSQSPDVYWDIQAANPHAAAARTALADGLRRITALVDDGDAAGFAAEIGTLRAFYGDDLGHHQRRCADLFSTLAPDPSSGERP